MEDRLGEGDRAALSIGHLALLLLLGDAGHRMHGIALGTSRSSRLPTVVGCDHLRRGSSLRLILASCDAAMVFLIQF